MNKCIEKYFRYSVLSFLLFCFVFPVSAGEKLKDRFEAGLLSAGEETGHVEVMLESGFFGGAESLPEMVGAIVGIILSLVGVFFLGLMIYGGYIWMMARGNEQEVEKAKNIIINSVIGIIIVVAAYAFTAFISGILMNTVT